MNRIAVYGLTFCFLSVSGCSLNTELTIPEKKLPETFAGKKEASTIAKLNWREYFTDKHLQKLIDAAVKNNPDLQMALQRIEVSRSSVKLANGALLPQVSLNVGGSVRRFGLYTMDGAGNATTEITPGQIVPTNLPDMYLGLQSSWEIDVWGKLRNQRQSAISTYLSSLMPTLNESTKALKNDLMKNVLGNDGLVDGVCDSVENVEIIYEKSGISHHPRPSYSVQKDLPAMAMELELTCINRTMGTKTKAKAFTFGVDDNEFGMVRCVSLAKSYESTNDYKYYTTRGNLLMSEMKDCEFSEAEEVTARLKNRMKSF